MKATVSPTLNSSANTLLLPIRDTDHMFNAPPVDALSPGIPEILGVSGTQYLLDQLRIGGPLKVQTVVLALPDDQIVAGLAGRIQQALQRFAEFRIEQYQTSLREVRRRGWRATAVALILFSVFLALASLFASDVTKGVPSLLRKTLEYGFEITGWVMLWHPIELLVFEPFLLQDKIAALRKLMELRIVVGSWNECSIAGKAS